MCVCGHPGTQRTPVSVASPERSPSASVTVRDTSQPKWQAQVVSSQAGKRAGVFGGVGLSRWDLDCVSQNNGGQSSLGSVSAAAQVCFPGDKGLRQSLRLQGGSRCWVDTGGPGFSAEQRRGDRRRLQRGSLCSAVSCCEGQRLSLYSEEVT